MPFLYFLISPSYIVWRFERKKKKKNKKIYLKQNIFLSFRNKHDEIVFLKRRHIYVRNTLEKFLYKRFIIERKIQSA